MTDINDIISDNFDTGICTKPDIIDDSKACRRGYIRVISTRRAHTVDALEGIVARKYYDSESYDSWITWVISNTEADAENILKAIKKVCATYTGGTDENILEWEGGEWKPFNNVRYEVKFVLLKRKSGIAGY